jgi:CheY-like chemotaxis protein
MVDTPPAILVVDDDPGFRALLVEFLTEEGYHPVAASPVDALAMASQETPALALLDAMMPDIDGPTLCRYLRSRPRTRSIPVIFITGLSRDALAPRLIGCEPWGFLAKPCSLEDLLHAVGRHLPPTNCSAS